jgi:ubiquinone/menaquinone biosynthesis C-methylase UbiE
VAVIDHCHPDFETHRALYARDYQERPPQEFLRLAEPMSGRRVLDLCGGDGRLSTAACAAGAASVTMVECELQMVPPALRRGSSIMIHYKPVHEALAELAEAGERFDLVACQRAVNYWLTSETVVALVAVMAPAGLFVFDTFHRPPPPEPQVSAYKFAGHAFAEVSWRVGDFVHHVQARDGMLAHATCCRWIPPPRFRTLLRAYFRVTERREGDASIYRCQLLG